MRQKNHRQMLLAIRWLTMKAALLQFGGCLFIVAAILPLALMAFVKEPDGAITLALGFASFCALVTAVFKLISGALYAYSYGRKPEEFISRLHASLIESGDITQR